MNNLYGHSMSQYLPYGGFKWIKNTNETINRILNKKDDSLHGYFWKQIQIIQKIYKEIIVIIHQHPKKVK